MRNAWGLLLMLAAVFCLGWAAHGWHNAKNVLAANESAEKTRQKVTEITRKSGEALEAKIAELKANETHTEREIRTEIIKPVFSNVCASDGYVRLFNESIDKAERTLSGKSADSMLGRPASPFRSDRQ
ncbi:MAG: hypothetical protein WCB03_22050 [Rouxiella badensis]|uniref:hypothetical protein n=1 Tax=Rouxiella badensis TaxID=1646377 RepID=UPI003C444329